MVKKKIGYLVLPVFLFYGMQRASSSIHMQVMNDKDTILQLIRFIT